MVGKKGVLNKTRKTLVVSRYRLCRSVASKAKGLMFTNESSVKEHSLIFEFASPRAQSLHMFFVFYPIDVLFLDGNKKVIDMKEMFRPFTIYNSGRRSQYVIELPRGSIARSKTKIGDILTWQ